MAELLKNNFDWSAVSAIVDILGLFTIWIPAIIYYIYSHISFMDCWIIEETSNGLTIALHNKVKYSIYVSYCNVKIFCNKDVSSYKYDMNAISIKPDEICQLKIDINDIDIPSRNFFCLKVKFNGRRSTYYQIMKRRK